MAYAALAALWVIASDHVLYLFVRDSALTERIGTYKGFAFVAVTALLLYFALA